MAPWMPGGFREKARGMQNVSSWLVSLAQRTQKNRITFWRVNKKWTNRGKPKGQKVGIGATEENTGVAKFPLKHLQLMSIETIVSLEDAQRKPRKPCKEPATWIKTGKAAPFALKQARQQTQTRALLQTGKRHSQRLAMAPNACNRLFHPDSNISPSQTNPSIGQIYGGREMRKVLLYVPRKHMKLVN